VGDGDIMELNRPHFMAKLKKAGGLYRLLFMQKTS